MSEKIKVRIQGRQEVRYNQIVEMTREQYQAIEDKLNSGDRKISARACEEIERWLDLLDVFDCDDFELDGFEIDAEAE